MELLYEAKAHGQVVEAVNTLVETTPLRFKYLRGGRFSTRGQRTAVYPSWLDSATLDRARGSFRA